MKRLFLLMTTGWNGFLFFLSLSLLLYGNTLNHSYNMDDELVTLGHPRTSEGIAGIPEILSSPYYEDDQGYSYEYRPLTHVSFALEHQFFGESAQMSHLINVLLFAITCLFIYRFSFALFPAPYGVFALIVSMLFLTHPMHSEVVASIKNRDELLALLFGLLSLKQIYRQPVGMLSIMSAAPLMFLALLSKLTVAPLLILSPALGVVLQHDRRTIATIGLIVTLVFVPYIIIRDWPLWWVSVVVGAMLTAYFTVHVSTRPSIIKSFFKHWLTFSMPRKQVSCNPLVDGKSIIAHALSVIPLILFVFTNDTIYLLYSVVLVALFPFWTGRAMGALFVLSIVVIMFYQIRVIHHSLFVALAVYSLVIGESCNISSRKQLLSITMVALGQLISTLINIHLDAGLLSVLYYMPAQIFLWTGRKRISLVFLLVLIFAVAVAVVAIPNLDTAIVLLGLLLMFAFIWSQDQFNRFAKCLNSAALLLVLLVAATAMLINHHADPIPSKPLSQTEVAFRPEKARESITALEDRPLSYVEYPLGFDADVSTRIGTASAIMGHYLKMILIPWPQAFYYGFDEVPVTDMKSPWAILSAAIHFLLLIIALVLVRSHPILSFGIIAYLASIFLFSNLVSPVAGMIADRLTYVASFGFCLALGYVFHLLFEKFNAGIGRKVVTAAFVLLLVGWGGMTIARNSKWKDALTLMRNDIKHVPNSAQAHNLLASHLMKNSFEPEYASEAISMRQEAIGHFKQAVRIWPEFFNVWYDIGRAYMTINQPDNALPAYKEAHRLDSTFYDATINVAIISEQRGNIPQAIDYYERCIRSNPEMREPYGNLSYLLFREGRFEESAAVNELAIIQHPAWKDPYLNLSRTYQALGDAERANDYALRAQQMP